MTFVNEFVPLEDIHKHSLKEKWDNHHAFHPYDLDNPMSPMEWIVDKERDIFLIQLAGSDGPEYTPELYYVLGWKGEYVWLTLIISRSEGSITKDKGSRTWDLVAMHKPENSEVSDEALITAIKEALTAYGDRGLHGQLTDYKVDFTF